MINKNKIIIRNSGGHSIIKFNEIIYLKGEGMYTTIYTNNSDYVVSRNLKCFEDKLPKYLFIRIHQSYMLNINVIEKVLSNKSKIITETGIELPISRNYKNKVKMILEDYYVGVRI